jgi:hypothetical protein
VTDQEKKQLLRKAINDLGFPIHCSGCDEWGCGGEEESGSWHEVDDDQLERVWAVIKSWEKT